MIEACSESFRSIQSIVWEQWRKQVVVLVKIQHQQHEGANVNVEAGSCSIGPAGGYLHQEISHVLANRLACIHRI